MFVKLTTNNHDITLSSKLHREGEKKLATFTHISASPVTYLLI